MIKGKSKGNQTGDISVDDFGSFFEKLNVQNEVDISKITFPTENEDPFEELNAPFSEIELQKKP